VFTTDSKSKNQRLEKYLSKSRRKLHRMQYLRLVTVVKIKLTFPALLKCVAMVHNAKESPLLSQALCP